ncbi:C-C motif chemokine 20-like [Pristis pectinata]|uniref:C-C motif chemokine 20-like n=1 Tax=Pristis pectinata TaxID=685728 RepID=UPI00223E2670|nr:C-C motif chemokine 20-like [Pristis pectinata]
MNTLKKLAPVAMLSLIMLSMFSDSVSAVSLADCCLNYSKHRLPRKYISGYVEQKSNEICEIDAVIFYTIGRRAVCADPDQQWVKRALKFLSKILKKMSQD